MAQDGHESKGYLTEQLKYEWKHRNGESKERVGFYLCAPATLLPLGPNVERFVRVRR